MPYPALTEHQRRYFARHGWIVVRDAVPAEVLDEIDRRCLAIHADAQNLAYDWAWDEKEAREERSFRIIQASPGKLWPELADLPYRRWLVDFGSALMGVRMEFWYDQYLAKPPERSVPTYWHQDEGYWGRNLDDKGITCWMPLQDVNATNGCMHFIDEGHRDGVLEHRLVPGMKSDLLTCDVDEGRMVVCAIKRGDVTFHHSKMPHMTTANQGPGWRKAVSNHMQAPGSGGEGDHYPWKITVDQFSGKVIIPDRR